MTAARTAPARLPPSLRRGCVALAASLFAGLGCGKLLTLPEQSEPWNVALAGALHTQVREITLAEQHQLLAAYIDLGLRDPLANPYFLVGVLGCALWTVAYWFLVRQGIRDRIHTLPMLAICLNFTWEVMAVFVLPDPSVLWSILEWSWIAIDVGLLALLVKYGRAHMRIPDVQRWFYPVLATTLALCFLGQLSFVLTFGDLLGFIVAFVINLVMSVLFIGLFYERQQDLLGLNYPAAWLKMFGTACTSIQCADLLPRIRPDIPTWGWLTFLYWTIFAFDALYVFLLWRRRRELRA